MGNNIEHEIELVLKRMQGKVVSQRIGSAFRDKTKMALRLVSLLHQEDRVVIKAQGCVHH